jgi:hypothetical protein
LTRYYIILTRLEDLDNNLLVICDINSFVDLRIFPSAKFSNYFVVFLFPELIRRLPPLNFEVLVVRIFLGLGQIDIIVKLFIHLYEKSLKLRNKCKVQIDY